MNSKFYTVNYVNAENDGYKTFEEAVLQAKRKTAHDRDGDDYFVMQAIARVSAPVPEAVVTNLD